MKYEVVYLRPDRHVFDIGLMIDPDSDTGVMARCWYPYSMDDPRYGASNKFRWKHSGVFLTINEWRELSCNKSTKCVCEMLGISYAKVENNSHREAGRNIRLYSKAISALKSVLKTASDLLGRLADSI